MKKLRTWLIHKLGGLVFNDLPTDIQMQWIEKQTAHAMRKDFYNRFDAGFKTKL